MLSLLPCLFHCRMGSWEFPWVLQKITTFHYDVGVSCEGFEEELLAMFVSIEVNRELKDTARSFNSVFKISKRVRGANFFH